MGNFIVQFESGQYLVLQGVFEYERSTTDIQHATIMPRSRAHAYAAMWKNSVVIQVG